MTNRTLFVGLGSPHGDDRAGWLVMDRLRDCGVAATDAVALQSPDEIWQHSTADRELAICDAAVDLGDVGTICRWVWPGVRLPEGRHGSHDLPLHEVLVLGQTLGMCPANVVIWTITGGCFVPDAEVSPAVRAAAVSLADSLWRDGGDA